MKPFLKWAGGKRWLVRRRPDLFEHSSKRYIEPFLGSGAAFFHILPPKSVLADVNPALINVYECLRGNHKRVWSLLQGHAKCHSDEYYYFIRAKLFRSDFARAAQFLYLNRTCWNGLYRENLRGEFNVPRGTKNTVVFDDDDFAAVAAALVNTRLMSVGFETVIDHIKEGDFAFIDPPYTVKHNGNGFVKYNEKIFSWSDQVKLAARLKLKAKCGATILVTNAFHPTVTDLYKGFAKVVPISRASVLSGNSKFRSSTQEALIFIGDGWASKDISQLDSLSNGARSICHSQAL
jgi:DNA adenine methylase